MPHGASAAGLMAELYSRRVLPSRRIVSTSAAEMLGMRQAQTCGEHGGAWAPLRSRRSCLPVNLDRRAVFTSQQRAAASPPGVGIEAAPAAQAVPAAPATSPPPSLHLPFFPDRRCVEDIQLPSLADCHHYINLTNGIEALPRLQLLGLPYRFLRLPSTRCEQQQFEALMNDLDADLLMRLALGQCCLVHDLGSRNKKRGAPRAVWYGLEFIRYALRRLWLGERGGGAYLRGYSVANVFEGHVSALSDGTKKKLRYYSRYISPEGLPHLHLYGCYAATQNDGDKAMYAALLRHCEEQQQQQAQQQARAQAQVQAALAAAAAPLQALSEEQRSALLHGGDIHAAAEQLLGMRLFLGGISHSDFHAWAERTGFQINAAAAGSGASSSSSRGKSRGGKGGARVEL